MSDTPFISKSDLKQYAHDAGLIMLGAICGVGGFLSIRPPSLVRLALYM